MLLQQIYASDSHKLTIESMIHEVGPLRLRQDAFIFQLALMQLIKSHV